MVELLKGLLLVTVAAYLVVAASAWVMQSRMLYLPQVGGRSLVASPADIGLEFEEVKLAAADGVPLHGWFVPHRRSRATLLFFHGNAGNISHRLDSLQIFHELGLSVLILDYRGYGRSGGRPTEEGTRLDAEAAWRHLIEERDIEPARIVLFGRSLGAAVAAKLAARKRPGALILESAFISVPELGADLYPFLPVRWLSRFSYDTRAYIGQVRCPVLVVHSVDDEIVPYAHGEALYEAAPSPKEMLRLRGGHNDGFLLSRARYLAELDAFLAGAGFPKGREDFSGGGLTRLFPSRMGSPDGERFQAASGQGAATRKPLPASCLPRHWHIRVRRSLFYCKELQSFLSCSRP